MRKSCFVIPLFICLALISMACGSSNQKASVDDIYRPYLGGDAVVKLVPNKATRANEYYRVCLFCSVELDDKVIEERTCDYVAWSPEEWLSKSVKYIEFDLTKRELIGAAMWESITGYGDLRNMCSATVE